MINPVFYVGRIKEVIDPKIYIVSVEVPGIFEELKAFPRKGQLDEPKPGDPVVLLGLDPLYNSYYLWEGLKETEFRGIRVAGKEITWDEDKIMIGVYSGENEEDGSEVNPDKAMITLDKDGNIKINATADVNIEVQGTTTLKSTKTIIKGPGKLTIENGTVIPDPSGGPFVATKVTPPQGSPLPSGNSIILGG